MYSITCTPEREQVHTTSTYHHSSPESDSPYTPPMTNPGLGIFEMSQTSPMPDNIPSSTADVWRQTSQAFMSPTIVCEDPQLWTGFHSSSLHPTSNPLDYTLATTMSMYYNNSLMATSLTPSNSIPSFAIPPDSMNYQSIMLSPSHAPTSRSITPSVCSLDDHKPILDGPYTSAETPASYAFYPHEQASEGLAITMPADSIPPGGEYESMQATHPTFGTPGSLTNHAFNPEIKVETHEFREEQQSPSGSLNTPESEDKDVHESMAKKLKRTRQRNTRRKAVANPPRCTLCKRNFSRKHNLQQHMERIHNDNPPRDHHCELCHLSFARQTDLDRHCISVRHYLFSLKTTNNHSRCTHQNVLSNVKAVGVPFHAKIRYEGRIFRL